MKFIYSLNGSSPPSSGAVGTPRGLWGHHLLVVGLWGHHGGCGDCGDTSLNSPPSSGAVGTPRGLWGHHLLVVGLWGHHGGCGDCGDTSLNSPPSSGAVGTPRGLVIVLYFGNVCCRELVSQQPSTLGPSTLCPRLSVLIFPRPNNYNPNTFSVDFFLKNLAMRFSIVLP